MVWYSKVLLCGFSDFCECHFLSFSNFPPFRPPYVSTFAEDGTQMTDADIRRITLPGTLQEGHRGSAGQGKRRTDPGAALVSSSGLPLVLHSGIPPGRL
ncbi:unnamed protein product, partial [Staurois parvus]